MFHQITPKQIGTRGSEGGKGGTNIWREFPNNPVPFCGRTIVGKIVPTSQVYSDSALFGPCLVAGAAPLNWSPDRWSLIQLFPQPNCPVQKIFVKKLLICLKTY